MHHCKYLVGLDLFDGDIVLSNEQSRALGSDGAEGARQARAVVTLETKKWPDGVVPYVFSPDLSKLK